MCARWRSNCSGRGARSRSDCTSVAPTTTSPGCAFARSARPRNTRTESKPRARFAPWRIELRRNLTIGSLFSGIGGFELGLEWAGLGPVVWQCEIDAFCRSVLAKHWPNATRYTDVRAIDASAPRVDVICGGFPCQDVSNAGKRAGIDAERSGLWSEFARVVGVLRPRFVVVENVSALLGRGMDRVLGDLAALGYDADWSTLRASDVGAPH